MTERNDGGDVTVWYRCYGCGHRLAYAATMCPQCNLVFDDREPPKDFPDRCPCRHCASARAEAARERIEYS